ncbi:MAG: hypothetical protein J5640_03325 [Bacteroidales bacterium]|nr:hypothetical protein [Bacteroidales bacterium]
MMKNRLILLMLFAAAACGPKVNPDDGGNNNNETSVDKRGPFEVEIGKPLPLWQEGVLDIHAINTGSGECTFFILPDGTTILCDAGDLYKHSKSGKTRVAVRPTEESIPYKTYGSYIKYFLPQGHSMIDYFVLTHFHIDHMAYLEKGRINSAGGYAYAGPMGLYSDIKFEKSLDRLYPDYTQEGEDDDPNSAPSNRSAYATFLDYNARAFGLKAEKFQVGTDKQLAMKYNAAKYPTCKVFNYAVNGIVWDGTKEVNTHARYENGMSTAFLVSYGKFDYFTSGDLNEKSTCTAIAASIGKNIEGMKAHHHMSNEATFDVEMATYKPQVVVTQSFYALTTQPQQSIIQKYSGSTDLYFTNIDPSISTARSDIYAPCKGMNGHVVIRVAGGGDMFWVYMLDDTDKKYNVKSITGPYFCE